MGIRARGRSGELLRRQRPEAAHGSHRRQPGRRRPPGDRGRRLDDPSVELAFRVDGSDDFVDSRGEPVAGAEARDGRATTPVARQGDNVAAIWHDQALDTDPELMRAASQATLLALENGVAVLGGTLTIDSAPGRGMQLRGRIPLDARAGAR